MGDAGKLKLLWTSDGLHQTEECLEHSEKTFLLVPK